MMRRSKRLSANLLASIEAASLVVGSVVACGSTTEPGELVVAVDTNVPLPAVVDTVSLEITAGDGITYPYEFPVGDRASNPKSVELPATLGVVAGSAAGDTVRVRLMGLHNGSVVTLRDTTTTVPGDRTALFRVTLDGLCYGPVSVHAGTEHSTVDGGMPNASEGCESGESCILGGCEPNTIIDPATLPTFDPSGAFGTGSAGTCFPVDRCFGQSGQDPADASKRGYVAVNASDCSLAVPDAMPTTFTTSSPLNVAVPVDASFCAPGVAPCVIPLDQVDGSVAPIEGWSLRADHRLQLPPGLCERGTPFVLVSTSCAPKLPSQPICGSWNSVTSAVGLSDGGDPVPTALDSGLALLSDGAVVMSDGASGGRSGDDDGDHTGSNDDGGQMSMNDGSTSTGGDSSTDGSMGTSGDGASSSDGSSGDGPSNDGSSGDGSSSADGSVDGPVNDGDGGGVHLDAGTHIIEPDPGGDDTR